MNDQVYVYIEGSDFRPRDFQSRLEKSVQGTVKRHKKMESGSLAEGGEYWMSPNIDVDDHDEAIEKISDILKKIRLVLLDMRTEKTRVGAELVCYCPRRQKVEGIHISAGVIAQLAEVGAWFDMDQYGPD